MDYIPQFGQNIPNQDVGGMPVDDAMAQLQLKRKLAFADALRNQEAPQGQMVSGHYIAPSWTQQLANLYGKYTAGQQENQAMQQYGEAQATKAQKLGDLMKGKTVFETDAEGNQRETQVPYSKQELIGQLSQIDSSYAPKLFENYLSNLYKEEQPQKLGKDESLVIRNAAGKYEPVYTNVSAAKDKDKWSAPYTLGGQWVIKNENTGEIKQAVHMPTQITNAPVFKQESAESATVGKGFGEQYLDIQKTGTQAPGKIAKYARLGQLIEGVNTGKLTPLGTDIAATAASLGFNVDKKLGNKQAAEALSNSIALELRSTSEGGGMPGAMSDADREYLKAMVPNIGKTPEANKLMIDAATKIAQRQQEVARLARDYRTRNGHIDEGFYNALQQYSDSHPLFGGSMAPASGATDYNSKYGLTPKTQGRGGM